MTDTKHGILPLYRTLDARYPVENARAGTIPPHEAAAWLERLRAEARDVQVAHIGGDGFVYFLAQDRAGTQVIDAKATYVRILIPNLAQCVAQLISLAGGVRFDPTQQQGPPERTH